MADFLTRRRFFQALAASVEADQGDIDGALADIRAGRSVLAGRNGPAERHMLLICGVAVIAVVVAGSIVTVEPPTPRRRSFRKRRSKRRGHA